MSFVRTLGWFVFGVFVFCGIDLALGFVRIEVSGDRSWNPEGPMRLIGFGEMLVSITLAVLVVRRVRPRGGAAAVRTLGWVVVGVFIFFLIDPILRPVTSALVRAAFGDLPTGFGEPMHLVGFGEMLVSIALAVVNVCLVRRTVRRLRGGAGAPDSADKPPHPDSEHGTLSTVAVASAVDGGSATAAEPGEEAFSEPPSDTNPGVVASPGVTLEEAGGVSSTEARGTSHWRQPLTSGPVLLALAVLLFAAGALGALTLTWFLGRSSEPAQTTSAISASPSTEGRYEPPAPSHAQLLKAYFSEVEWEVNLQQVWVQWEWADGGTHRGRLFGPQVVIEIDADGTETWTEDREFIQHLASCFEAEHRRLDAIEAPSTLRREHANLVRAVRIEARRWKRFDVVLRTGATESSELKAWERWSKDAFSAQRRYLHDWTVAVRVESLLFGAEMPSELRRYVRRVEKL